MGDKSLGEMSEMEIYNYLAEVFGDVGKNVNALKAGAAKVAGDPFMLGMMLAEQSVEIHSVKERGQQAVDELKQRLRSKLKLAE